MPQDDARDEQKEAAASPNSTSVRQHDWRDLFAIPQPVKQVFGKFPLVKHPANRLPLRSPRQRDIHVLHVFTTADGALNGSPSFNPTCLKWQVYLKSCDINFRTTISNNHASPSGALPFLLPSSSSDAAEPPAPVPSSKLRRWAKEHGHASEEADALRSEAYLALIDHRVRRAWLHLLYLQQDNFNAVAHRLYVQPCSSNPFVQTAISHQLREAAQAELLKQSSRLSPQDLLQDAKDALASLSTLLGSDDWFFGAQKCTMFDASVFAYTHLLLDDGGMGWQSNELGDTLRGFGNLVQHRERMLRMYF